MTAYLHKSESGFMSPSNQDIAKNMEALPALRSEAIIVSGLTAISYANAEELITLRKVSTDGKNPSLVINEPENAKSGDKITSVTILENGEKRHFIRIHDHNSKKSPTGMQATAWMEVSDPKTNEPLLKDKKANIVISGQGFTGTPADLLMVQTAEKIGIPLFNPSPAQRQAQQLFAVGDGKLTSQTLETNKLLDDTLKAAKKKTDAPISLSIGSHSMNASAASALQTFATIRAFLKTRYCRMSG